MNDTTRTDPPADPPSSSADPPSSSAGPASPGPATSGGPPPWIDPQIQPQIEWRSGDVVISVPAKSGTTWMMNIVHQLRTGGDPDFEDLYVEVPWIEFVERPGQTRQERLERWAAMPTTRRRAFKTHSAPPALPYIEPGADRPEVQYIVVLRSPEEAAVSLKFFTERHSRAWFDLWGAPHGTMVRDDFATYYDEIFEGMGMADAMFRFLAAWWPLRDRPNVLMLHFSDLKRDHEGSIRTIADFLGFRPTPAQWPALLEYCSFPWMKAHERKFEVNKLTEVPVLEPGAMVRKGKVGAAAEDGMTDALAARLHARGQAILGDPRVLEWHYRGGPLPTD
ncbi:MAG: sulfotransferase domain-containing protein [Myxococcota bacterium]